MVLQDADSEESGISEFRQSGNQSLDDKLLPAGRNLRPKIRSRYLVYSSLLNYFLKISVNISHDHLNISTGLIIFESFVFNVLPTICFGL